MKMKLIISKNGAVVFDSGLIDRGEAHRLFAQKVREGFSDNISVVEDSGDIITELIRAEAPELCFGKPRS